MRLPGSEKVIVGYDLGSMDRMIGYGSNRPGDDCPERTEAERRTD